MTILNTGMDMAGVQVDAGQQAQRTVALVFVIACDAGMYTRNRR